MLVVWKGPTNALVMQPNSPRLVYGDHCRRRTGILPVSRHGDAVRGRQAEHNPYSIVGPVPSPGETSGGALPSGTLSASRFPSLPRQARSLAAAATRTIYAAIAGRPIFVPPDVLAERETICAACDENLSGRCRKCGCGVRAQLLRKTHLATERCPLDPPRWDRWSE